MCAAEIQLELQIGVARRNPDDCILVVDDITYRTVIYHYTQQCERQERLSFDVETKTSTDGRVPKA